MLGSTAARHRSHRRSRVVGGLALGAAIAISVVASAAAGRAGTAGTATVPTTPITAAPQPTTTTPTTFTSPADASNTALSVVAAYAERTLGTPVTDPACSRPPSAAAGAQFVCYGTKPGPSLVSLRVTIGEGRDLSFAVEVDQPSPVESEGAATTVPG